MTDHKCTDVWWTRPSRALKRQSRSGRRCRVKGYVKPMENTAQRIINDDGGYFCGKCGQFEYPICGEPKQCSECGAYLLEDGDLSVDRAYRLARKCEYLEDSEYPAWLLKLRNERFIEYCERINELIHLDNSTPLDATDYKHIAAYGKSITEFALHLAFINEPEDPPREANDVT